MDASHGTVENLKHFKEDEIRRITGNYSTCIGEGGFGIVYKGVLQDDLVAVKYIREEIRETSIEEVRIHSKMKHKNIVKLLGYCISGSNLMLITEYISPFPRTEHISGNLDHILHNNRNSSIPLDTRLGIAIGVAEALIYMHSMHLSSGDLIYHGDIKPANILLDENFTAKVSDFGLSRLLPGGITQYRNTVVGSMNYMDPERLRTGCLTSMSDVYSFGIVLLELIARRRANEGDAYLVGIFAEAKERDLRGLFDSDIANEDNIGILQEMVKLANECLRRERRKRPEMTDVAQRLCMLRRKVRTRQENTRPHSILESFRSWYKKSPSFLERNASNLKILSELENVKRFTMEEINDITENYSCLLGESGPSAKFFKGSLQDNTAVVVWKFLYADSEKAFINGSIVLSQIVHKNIIRLFGCCLQAKNLILIYDEYANKGSLMEKLGSQEDFPLDKRIGIAIQTAEALQYLHSSAAGIVGHGNAAASTILLDDKFFPKLTDFSRACKLIKECEVTASGSVITRDILEKMLYNYPNHFMLVLKNLESDVYRFGGVLFALISRDTNISLEDLVLRFTKAYQTDNSGEAFFDKAITAEEEINVFEEMGMLALKCTVSNVDEMDQRPTMKEVAEQLHMIRRCWKEHRAEATTQVTEIEATAVMSVEPRAEATTQVTETEATAVMSVEPRAEATTQVTEATAVMSVEPRTEATTQVTKIEATAVMSEEPKLPNLMRRLYGYRRIQL